MRCPRVQIGVTVLTVFVAITALPVSLRGMVHRYEDTFRTMRYADILKTTAWWDTVSGEVKLPAVELVTRETGLGRAFAVTVAGATAYVAAGDSGLQVVDVSDVKRPVRVSSIRLGFAYDVDVRGDAAYVAATSSGLQIVDVSTRTNPRVVSTYATPSPALAVTVDGHWAYVAAGEAGLLILDVSDGKHPVLAGSYDTPGFAFNVAVSGRHAYVADRHAGVRVVNVSNPVQPVPVGSFETWPAEAYDVVVDGSTAYVAAGNSGLIAVDVTNRSVPVEQERIDTPGTAVRVDVSGGLVAVGDYQAGIDLVQVGGGTAPLTRVGTYDTVGHADGLCLSGTRLYVADEEGGLVILTAGRLLSPVVVETTLSCTLEGRFTSIEREGTTVLLTSTDVRRSVLGAGTGNGAAAIWGQSIALEPIQSAEAWGDRAWLLGPTRVYTIDISNALNPLLLDVPTWVSPPGSRLGGVIGASGEILLIEDVQGSVVFQDSFDTDLGQWVLFGGRPPIIRDGAFSSESCEGCGESYALSADRINADVVTIDCDVYANWDTTLLYGYYSDLFIGLSDSSTFVQHDEFYSGPAPVISQNLLSITTDWWDWSWGRPPGHVYINGSIADSLTNAWQHIRILCDGVEGTATLYVNGVPVQTLQCPELMDQHVVLYGVSPHYGGCFNYVDNVIVTEYDNGVSRELRVLDGTMLNVLSGWPLESPAVNLATEGTWVVVGERARFAIVDLSDPVSPTLVGEYSLGGGVAIDGDRIVQCGGGTRVFDISIPQNPVLVGESPIGDGVPHLLGDYVLTIDSVGLHVLDVSNPAAPTCVVNYRDSIVDLEPDGDNVILLQPNGLQVLRLLERAYREADSTAVSRFIESGQDTIVRVMIQSDRDVGVTLEASADAGGHWWATEEGQWMTVPWPGTTMLWRSHHRRTGGGNATLRQLRIDWLYRAAALDSVRDVAGDEGGWLRLHFTRSAHDFVGDATPIASYGVWRRMDGSAAAVASAKGAVGLEGPNEAVAASLPVERRHGRWVLEASATGGVFPPGQWEWVATINALQQDAYTALLPSVGDSTGTGVPQSVYVVTAHTTDPAVWYVSAPDSGYSVDNLAPQAPHGLVGRQVSVGGGLALTWADNGEHDLSHYVVYRGTDGTFVPDASNRLATVTIPSYVDTTWTWDGGYVYKVTAVDVHGNESDVAVLDGAMVTGVLTPMVPDHPFLSQNVPNPFNPVTRIRYGLTGRFQVELAVYDVSGRRVRVLESAEREGGVYEVTWDGRDDRGVRVSSGVYFVRLAAGSFRAVRKMVLMK